MFVSFISLTYIIKPVRQTRIELKMQGDKQLDP